MKHSSSSVLALSLVIYCLPGWPQDQPAVDGSLEGSDGSEYRREGLLPRFEEVDTNQDGELSRAEVAAIDHVHFGELDVNQDDAVQRAEYLQYEELSRRGGLDYPAFEELDESGDGEISRDELSSVEGLDFSSLDADQDESISRREYERAIELPEASGQGEPAPEPDGEAHSSDH